MNYAEMIKAMETLNGNLDFKSNREIHIKIIVEDGPYDSGDSRVIGIDRITDNYVVRVSNKQVKEFNTKQITVAAHELGHVLADAFRTPTHENKSYSQSPSELYSQIYNKELEAWDLAEMMATKEK